ncbi:class I SAM-dependent methyltransferase [Sandaracinus amylolyticus]|uniref:class I SAM-dependent methyltransferase n=1 Tax=Sandaracinus amylolyticus TaxID=927083 RepID=UPI00196A04A9|nr:methyltransferase domain-containing protein [Sandaracinus amylolyticus]
MTLPPLRTSIGEIPLHEYRLTLGDRTWSFLHTGAVVTLEDEQRFLERERDRLPYGVMLWPASIALAHDVLTRAGELRGKRVLELGAGTGVPGIVAASLGARVLQTDRNDVALHVCGMNAERNRVSGIEVRSADWETFTSDEPFDVILGSDVLYATTMHDRLRAICEAHLAPGGVVLFSDPFRAQSLPVLEAMDAEGWRAGLAKWSIAVESGTRTIAVYELSRR